MAGLQLAKACEAEIRNGLKKLKHVRQQKEMQWQRLRESLADLAAMKARLHSAPGVGNFPHDDGSQSRQEPVDHSRIA